MAEIEQLRDLLFRKEQARLEELEEQFKSREKRVEALCEILPDSLTQLQDSNRLKHSLKPQLSVGLEEVIQQNPKRFAAMFYPVIGPAIRRAVGEALKGLLDNINRTMEQSFSARSWRWRLEAWRTGVPFGEIVIKHTLAYSIDEVFLVQRETGLLIARAVRAEAEVLDRDAVAAMLTAIQRFMQESFATDDDNPIRSIEVDAHTLWIVPGVHAAMIALIKGTVAREARGELQQKLELLHREYGEVLVDVSQQQDMLPALTTELEECLLIKQLDHKTEDSTEGNEPAKKRYTAWWLLFIGLLVFAAWQTWQWWQLDNERDRLVQTVQKTPGWVVLKQGIDAGRVHLQVLRDPLAASVQQILEQASIDDDRVAFILSDYQSAELSLVQKRIARAMNIPSEMFSPANEAAEFDSNLPLLKVTGELTPSSWQQLEIIAPIIGVKISNAPNLSIESLQQSLNIGEQTKIRWDRDVLEISGLVSQQSRENLLSQLAALQIKADVNDIAIGAIDYQVLQLKQNWDQHTFNFIEEVELTAESEPDLINFMKDLLLLQQQFEERLPIKIYMEGFTDGLFTTPVNVQLRAERAQWVHDYLAQAGVLTEYISVLTNNESEQNSHLQRAVSIDIQSLPAD